jgi:DNA-binding CsgD family transcriptional regulator
VFSKILKQLYIKQAKKLSLVRKIFDKLKVILIAHLAKNLILLGDKI